MQTTSRPLTSSAVVQRHALGRQWPTLDPFLFCAHHLDAYPQGNGAYGPHPALLQGRPIGSDFSGEAGWNMYHGEQVPGFPAHPHRGFETVTLVRTGLIDHADSLGAVARFGQGDVQWVTAGRGLQHSEMFPLLHTDRDNPLELFQIWLNLPARSKMVPAHFTMLWNENIPRVRQVDAEGHATELALIAGALPDAPAPLAPPPQSWAAQDEADVAIWTIRMEPGARWTLPAAALAAQGTQRMLYYFVGEALSVDGKAESRCALELDASRAVVLHNTGTDAVELVLLQGRPIGEPVVQYGPFVMNSREEIMQAMHDFQRTQFGGWHWEDSGPVHGPEARRFARHGKDAPEEVPPGSAA